MQVPIDLKALHGRFNRRKKEMKLLLGASAREEGVRLQKESKRRSRHRVSRLVFMVVVLLQWSVHSINLEAVQRQLVMQSEAQVFVQRHIVRVFGIQAHHTLALLVVVHNGADQ